MPTLVLLLLMLVTTPTWSSPDLARSKNCMACHAVERRLVGPSFKQIAQRGARADLLAQRIQRGSVGQWGAVPMPANPQVSDSEAAALATWILTQ